MTKLNKNVDRRRFLNHLGLATSAALIGNGISHNSASAKDKTNASEGLRFEVYDVFTGNRLKGNQLAVFHDARGLSDELLQQIASEMNYSETTFVYPNDKGQFINPVRTRVFTPSAELPFAGHPTLGTAIAISEWRGDDEPVVLKLDVGDIPINFASNGDGLIGTMSQIDPTFSDTHKVEEIVDIIGLDISDVDMGIPPQTVSTGLSRILIMLNSLDAVGRMKVDYDKLDSWNNTQDFKARNVYAMTRETETDADFRGRMQLRGLRDDPVTGSSGGTAISWLVRHGFVPNDTVVKIEQGFEIDRAGEMYVSARLDNDKITNVLVGGRAVRSMEGRLFV